MKRSVVILSAGLIAALSWLSHAADTLQTEADGTVRLGELNFSSWRSFVGSQAFRESGRRCGAETVALERAAARGLPDRQFRDPTDCSNSLTRILDEYYPNGVTYSIPVWFHVIQRTDGVGFVSDARIRAQIRVLNEDFGALSGTLGQQGFPTGLSFELAGVTRSVNNTWFADETEQAESDYKGSLNVDPSRYLNIYSNAAAGYLGYAYFPVGSAGAFYDGVVLYHESVGGRNNGFSVYDEGRTAVHEIGHWLGLYHTFQGYAACSNTYSSGDRIVDTNAENDAFYGCGSRTTCGTPDPTDNYMNYSNDECMVRFTAEQSNRAVCSLLNYRPNAFRILDENGDDILPLILPLLINKD